MGSYINARLPGDSKRDIGIRDGHEGAKDRRRNPNFQIQTRREKQTRALHLHIWLLAGALMPD